MQWLSEAKKINAMHCNVEKLEEVIRMETSDLAKRMKRYEAVSKTTLVTRMPVILRIDGKAFHTLTRGFQKPFDRVLNLSMMETMRFLCKNIQGCVLGYTQSDEITLVLVDYKKLTSNPWFDYEVQKMCSVGASMATVGFNNAFARRVEEFSIHGGGSPLYDRYLNALEDGAMFDCRAFNVPREEVTNNIYWRQLDASRNSIQMLGQVHFAHKELQNKSCNEIQDMLMTRKGINWNNLPAYQKRGSCCVKRKYFEEQEEDGKLVKVERSHWEVDVNIPIFKGDGREYIEQLLEPEE